MNHVRATARRARGVPGSNCTGRLRLVESRREQAGPRTEVYRCDGCGNTLVLSGGVVVTDGLSVLPLSTWEASQGPGVT